MLWQKLFQLLAARVDFWDKDRYEGFSYRGDTSIRHEVSWIDKHSGALILFPNAPFHNFDPFDLVAHLKDNSRVGNNPNAVPNDAGVVFIDFMGNNKQTVSAIKEYIRRLCLQGNLVSLDGKDYGGTHMSTPGKSEIKEKQTELINAYESEQPCNRYYITNAQNDPQRLKLLSFTYGQLDIHRIPVEQSKKFVIVTRSVNNFGLDDEHLSVGQFEIPLASNWGQTLLYTLYGLPFHTKLSILHGQGDEKVRTIFVTPSEARLELIDLAEMCLTKEIIAELTCLTIEMPKLAALTTRVLDDLESFCKNGTHIFPIIISVKRYAKENIPKKHKGIMLKAVEYYQQIKRRMIEFGGNPIRIRYKTAKSFSCKKRIYFDNLVDSGHTFEPHTYNLNKLNN